MSKDYETQQQEDTISASTGKLILYIVGLFLKVAEQVNVFKDVIYVQRKYDPIVVEKTVTDINLLITVVYPYLPEDLRNTVLTTSKSDIEKVVPTYNRIAEILYNKGFLKLDHFSKYRTHDLGELLHNAVSEDMKHILKEYKRLQRENAKLREENAKLRKKLDELLFLSSNNGGGIDENSSKITD